MAMMLGFKADQGEEAKIMEPSSRDLAFGEMESLSVHRRSGFLCTTATTSP
jgi:hypothetical protein